jgi:toluene monooxygenase electron transfer component
MRVQLAARNRAQAFDAPAHQRILFAGLANGLGLPYECGSGTCGTCKARLVSGEVDDLWPLAPGRKHLKQPNEILMCQCAPRGDVALEVGGNVYAMDPGACTPHARLGVLGKVSGLTHDVMAFSLTLDRPCDFQAGQFMLCELPDVPGYRAYSMVNFERATQRLDFVVKKKPGGSGSAWLSGNAIEGATVKLFGPLGAATFSPSLAKHLLLIAGGSGIAGMMSILARACEEHYFAQYNGHVFFGVRTLGDAFYLDELSAFRENFSQKLNITIALSDEDVPVDAAQRFPLLTFDKGFVHEVAAKHMTGKYQNVRAYLAGPPVAVDAAMRVLLLQAKLPATEIKFDKFN